MKKGFIKGENSMKLLLRIFVLSNIVLLVACTNKLPKIPEEKNIISTINIKDMTMSFIDIDEQALLGEWKLKKPYTGGLLLSDNDTLLLYGKQVESVDLYSLSNGKKIDSWKTGKGIVNGLLLTSNNAVVFADQHLHRVRIFSLNGEELGTVNTGKNPLSILQEKINNKLYVISFDDKRLSVINLDKMKVDRSFPIHTNAAGVLLREEENELWIGGHGEGNTIERSIHVYNLSTGQFIRNIAAPTMPINFVENNGSIYALSHGTSIVYKFNPQGDLLGTIQVGANPFEMTVLNGKLVIAGYDSSDVNCIELETLSILKTIPVGKGPFKIIIKEKK